MKAILALALLFLAVSSHAALSDFQSLVSPANLKPFALDLGGVLGAAGTDTGRSWGFPGFEAGLVSGLQFKPDRDDTILRNANVKTFGVPMVSVGVGLPFNFGVVAHGVSAGGVRVVGGGLRFSLFEAPVVGKALPTAGVSFFGDSVHHQYFTAEHYSANASVGWALPLITPFVGAGYDLTRVKVSAATTVGLVGQSSWARGSRFSLGTDITPFPLLRLRAAYQILHGMPGATLDLLFKF